MDKQLCSPIHITNRQRMVTSWSTSGTECVENSVCELWNRVSKSCFKLDVVVHCSRSPLRSHKQTSGFLQQHMPWPVLKSQNSRAAGGPWGWGKPQLCSKDLVSKLFSKFLNTKITSNIFSNHNGVTLENNMEKCRNYTHTRKLNNFWKLSNF